MLIVKLGGSVIQETLTEINPKVFECVNKLIALDERLLIVTGGGKVCRFFRDSLKKSGFENENNLHWVGTRAVNLQADFVRSLFPIETTYQRLIDSENILQDAISLRKDFKYFAAGGWEIGHSSDFDATRMAISFKSSKILRISDIDYVYTADPDVDESAKKIESASWEEYLDIIGNPEKHEPGASYPVDPIAARVAESNNLKFYFTSLDKFLNTSSIDFKNFDGTIIGD
jgi:uridylate kinase